MKYTEVADVFKMDRKQLLMYLVKADEVLRELDKTLSLYVSGGANMCLYVGSRDSTHDIDTFPSCEDTLRVLAKEMQEYFPLPDTWLNPSGTMFITKEMCDESILSLDMNNLKVYFLKHEAMLVLKVLSGRRENKYPDKRDTIALLQKTNIRSLQEIDALVMKYKYKWNNPYVMQFAEDALKECWEDYTPDFSTIGISDSLKKYWLLTNQSGGLTPSTRFQKNHNQ